MSQIFGKPGASDSEEQTVSPVDPAEAIVFFFRSEEQANGRPMTKDGISQPDGGYNKNFGFDIYRPGIYGNYAIVKNAYLSDVTVPVAVKNRKNVAYQVNRNFELSSSDGSYTDKYYFPNILIMPSKTVTIYAKMFVAEEMTEPRTMQVALSNNNGIAGCPATITFPVTPINVETAMQSYPIIPITIQTSGDKIIDDIILTVTEVIGGVTKTVGKCTICKNRVYSPRVCFVNIKYDPPAEHRPEDNIPITPPLIKAPASEAVASLAPPPPTPAITSTMNAESLCREVNEQGMNQAGLHLVSGSRTHNLPIYPRDYIPVHPPFNMGGSAFKDRARGMLDTATNRFKKIEDFLYLAVYKFFEPYAIRLMDAIEIEYRKLKVTLLTYNNSGGTSKSVINLMNPNETFRGLMGDEYEEALLTFCYFLKNSRFNIFPTFSAPFASNENDGIIGLGFVPGKGVMLSNEIIDLMNVIHELGHNFGLGHTFRIPPPRIPKIGVINKVEQPADIDLRITASYENIMDYCSDKNSFISFQWKKMRDFAATLTSNPDDFDFSTSIEKNFLVFNDSAANYITGTDQCAGLKELSIILSSRYIVAKENEIIRTNGNVLARISIDETLRNRFVNIWTAEIRTILNTLNTI